MVIGHDHRNALGCAHDHRSRMDILNVLWSKTSGVTWGPWASSISIIPRAWLLLYTMITFAVFPDERSRFLLTGGNVH